MSWHPLRNWPDPGRTVPFELDEPALLNAVRGVADGMQRRCHQQRVEAHPTLGRAAPNAVMFAGLPWHHSNGSHLLSAGDVLGEWLPCPRRTEVNPTVSAAVPEPCVPSAVGSVDPTDLPTARYAAGPSPRGAAARPPSVCGDMAFCGFAAVSPRRVATGQRKPPRGARVAKRLRPLSAAPRRSASAK